MKLKSKCLDREVWAAFKVEVLRNAHGKGTEIEMTY